MSQIKFNCPNCREVILADENQMGKTVRCPFCDGIFTVPICETSSLRHVNKFAEHHKMIDVTKERIKRTPMYLRIVVVVILIFAVPWLYGFFVAFMDMPDQSMIGAAMRINLMNPISANGYKFYINVFYHKEIQQFRQSVREYQESVRRFQESVRGFQESIY